ncbi:MAG: alpha/beta hydrolase [bacterium]
MAADPLKISSAVGSEIEAANASGKTPVLFIHGLWLLKGGWAPWREMFEAAGYATVAANWPDEPETVEEARAHPELLAGKGVAEIADHLELIARKLTKKPAIIGHSFGGLFTQMLAGRGCAAVSVPIDPAPFRGVLPLPFSAIKAAFPVLGNPLNRNKAISLTAKQFRYAFGNAVSAEESDKLYAEYTVAAPGRPLFEASMANLNPFTPVKVDTHAADRGPMLVVSGEHDHIVPHAIAYASYKRQRNNSALTEFHEFKDRGHSLVIDAGWREIGEAALAFVQRFAPA